MKRRETDPASSQFFRYSSPSGTQRFTELHQEENREGGVRGDWNEMRWDQKRREQANQ